MPQPKEVTTVSYTLPCRVCGVEGRVAQDASELLCYTCMWQERERKAKDKQLYLLGAIITGLKMKDDEEFESITVTLPDGRNYTFSHGGYDGDYYIEVGKEE